MASRTKTHRPLWMIAAILAIVVLGGIALLGIRLRPYWIAKYRGVMADLRGAMLIHAPLAGTNLEAADLRGADLRGADLRGALLTRSRLDGATLAGADLRGAVLDDGQNFVYLPRPPGLSMVLKHADLTHVDIRGARYDAHTRWPAGFDPRRHGAVLAR